MTNSDRKCTIPGELVRDINRRYKLAQVRSAIIEGYEDAIAGRTVKFTGDIRKLVRNARSLGSE